MRTHLFSPSESQYSDLSDTVFHSMSAPFEYALKISIIGLWDYHFDDGSTTANQNLYEIYGYGPQHPEWSIELFLQHVITEDRERVHQALSDILANGMDFQAEYRIAKVDGQVRSLKSIGGIIYKDGKPHLLRGTTYDITEHKARLQKLAVERDQWEFVANSLGLGLWILDAETGETSRNGAHAKIFGHDHLQKPTLSLEEFLGHIVPEDRAKVQSIISETQNLRRSQQQFDCRIQRSDGAIRWISVAGKIIREEGQQPITYGVTQDITDTKERVIENTELEKRLLQSQKLELLGQLSGGVAHDINNILAAIQCNTELVLAGLEPTNPHFKNLTSVINSVNRSAELVRQLLAFARKDPIQAVEIDVDSEIEQIHLMLQKLIRENILLELKLNSRHNVIKLDRSHLVQILTNLVVNARDAIAEQGTISIETSITINEDEPACTVCSGRYIEKPCIRIAVSDTGSGIDAQTLPHIFEPFFTTKGIGKGTGLGLSTVYGLVKQNNGHLSCHSEEGKGTTVEIHLPITLKTETTEARTPDKQPEAIGQGLHVMVVEDEHEISSIMNIILKQQGFSVRVTDNAESALEIMETTKERFDLVISDIMLPGMNGVQLSKIVLNKHPDTKVLFMSGYGAEAIENYGVYDVGNAFIPKPFTILDFINKVEAVLMNQA